MNFLENIKISKAPSAIMNLLILVIGVALISISPSLKAIPNVLINTSFHDNQRLMELLLLCSVLVFNIFFINNKLLMQKSHRLVIYSIVLLIVISSALSESPRHSSIEISIFAGLCYLSVYIKSIYVENADLLMKRVIYIFWASALLAIVSFYTGYLTATIFNTPVKWPNPLTGFSNIRSFNQYQLWTLGLIILPLLTFNFKNRFIPALMHIALVAWAVLIFFSASRGALLAWFFGITITAIIYRKIAWPFIKLQILHISLGFLSYKVLFVLIPYLKQSSIVTGEVMRDTTYDRIELWTLALNLIKENPIFGVGPMHFAWHSPISAHPHNSLLQLMSEWGLPAALSILAVAGYGLYKWLKYASIKNLETKGKLQQNLAIALFFTVICSAIYSLVDGVIVMPLSQVMMFTIIGLMIGFVRIEETNLRTNSIEQPLFAGIVLLVLIWSTLPEIVQGVSDNERHFSIGYTAAGPRVWTEVRPAY